MAPTTQEWGSMEQTLVLWEFRVRLILQSEELWNIVKGRELKPEPVSLFFFLLKS